MAIKKKAAKPVHHETHPPVSLEEEPPKEERKVPVTQVVEVVEDDVSDQSSQQVEDAVPQAQTEEVPVAADVPPQDESPAEGYTEAPSKPEADSSDEKRKVLVDELFQKRTDKPVAVAPEISMHTTANRKSKPVYMWAVGIITACLVLGVSLFFFSGKNGNFPSVVLIPSPTPSPTATQTPSPTPADLKRDSLSVQVLNGGGKAGAATAMKTVLEDKGYVVSDTGNADAYTYDKTEILVKASKSAFLPILEADLKSDYTLGTSAATLEESGEYDVRVTVGKE